MNKEKVYKKVDKKYGVEPSELCNLSVSRIKELKVHNNFLKSRQDKFKIIKKPLGVITRGGSIGAGIAGTVNTIFPNIVPVLGSALTQSSNMSTLEKAVGFTFMASKPVDIISGPTIIGVGALVGAIVYSGYRLVKAGFDRMTIVSDRKKARVLSLKR